MVKMQSSSAVARTTGPRLERKVIEKNRRNRMKNLYFDLASLLPDYHSKVEGLALPDQIDEVVDYIKTLKMEVEKIRLKKETLMPTKRLYPNIEDQTTNKWPQPLVEVQNMGPNLDVILANGLDDYSKFHEIIKFVNQYGDEIASATFSKHGNTTIQLLQDKGAKSILEFGDGTSKKLKELACGISRNEVEELDLWDYKIESNIWEILQSNERIF